MADAEDGMARTLGFIAVLIAAFVVIYLYVKQVQTVSPAGTQNPRAQIDITGVKNDLLVIANAERRHFASDGKYVSLDDLIANHDISMQSPSRGPYTYSADVSEDSFRVTATYSGPPGAGMPQQLVIDQTMQITSQ